MTMSDDAIYLSISLSTRHEQAKTIVDLECDDR